MLTWYLPSLYGDIRLESTTEGSTKVTIHGLSPQEKVAMRALLTRAVRSTPFSPAWATPDMLEGFKLDRTTEQSLTLRATISQVQKVLSKPLKPNRKQVSIVRFSDGKIEEITESNIGLIESEATDTKPPKADVISEPEVEKSGKREKPTPKVATTVAQPVIGCPAPDFEAAEVRATRVLSAFLDPQQAADFARYQRFVAVGADTGHRYMLTSRNARSALQTYNRSLFDLDENVPLCVHDWEVPAAEELLGLFVHLRVPGLETYVRAIPDREGVLA